MVEEVEPDEAEWMPLREAAGRLGISTQTLDHHIRKGRLPTTRRVGARRHRWLLKVEVDRFAEQRRLDAERWVSWEDAAAIVGCSRQTVRDWAKAGRIEQRHAGTNAVPSLDRNSVERAGHEWRAHLAAKAAARQERQARLPLDGPPDLEHEWVGTQAAAELLGVGQNAARLMARTEKVPAVLRGHRWWFRREQLIVVANARAARGLQA